MKRLASFLALFAVAISASAATLNPIQLLNPAGSTNGQAILSTGASSAPAWGNVSLTGLSGILPIASGGTNASTASGTSLDNITGFAGTGFLTRTGAGTYAFQSTANGITLGNLAQGAANTVLANATGSTANFAAFSMPSCSTSASALTWTTSTGFACNTSINAATLGGATFAAPGTIGGTTPGNATFSSITASASLPSLYATVNNTNTANTGYAQYALNGKNNGAVSNAYFSHAPGSATQITNTSTEPIQIAPNGSVVFSATLNGITSNSGSGSWAHTGGFSVTGTVSGTGFSTYLASPPAIGSTAANAGTFTNLTVTGTLTGFPGRLLNIQKISTSGACTLTATAGATKARLLLVGGGGGSGGTSITTVAQTASTGGGGSGAYTETWISSGYGNSSACSVGAAGAAGAAGANAGGSGGQTTITINGTTYTANGGGGSSGANAVTPPFFLSGGAGGTAGASGNLINAAGSPGSPGLALITSDLAGGNGGSSIYGGTGSPGAGASGIATTNSGATAGNAGNAGFIEVEEYQ